VASRVIEGGRWERESVPTILTDGSCCLHHPFSGFDDGLRRVADDLLAVIALA